MIEPYYQHNGTTLYCGDAAGVLAGLSDGSVHCCVTSPPYWGLRDYGVEGQLGLESTPEEYVERLVAVFREVRRVLRADGTLWLNLGDSYAATGKSGGGAQGARWDKYGADTEGPLGGKWSPAPPGLKPKDLVGIPWRVAFGLQADGWYLRSDIIWHKPNPMPESVTDRPTKAHEYLFLLATSERYYYNAEAIKEPATYGAPNSPQSIKSPYGQGFSRRAKSENKERKSGAQRGRPGSHLGGSVPWEDDGSGRNKRTVWTVSTVPYAGAHFAVFPPGLIRPCIKAGCPRGGVVLDPFAGSGTTLDVARELDCKGIGIDLSADYLELARTRLQQEVFPFGD